MPIPDAIRPKIPKITAKTIMMILSGKMFESWLIDLVLKRWLYMPVNAFYLVKPSSSHSISQPGVGLLHGL
jgi:hypothetical protein